MAHYFNNPLNIYLFIILLSLIFLLFLSLTIQATSKTILRAEFNNVQIVGKPDIILRKKDTLIPVEYKNMNKPHFIYDSHKLQLYTYIYLLEKTKNISVPYGILKYNDAEVKIKNSHMIRKKWESTVESLIKMQNSGNRKRNHNNKRKCEKCEFSVLCPDSLSQGGRSRT